MEVAEVKKLYKEFFGKDITEPYVIFFGSEFMEFCLYLVSRSAQHSVEPTELSLGEKSDSMEVGG